MARKVAGRIIRVHWFGGSRSHLIATKEDSEPEVVHTHPTTHIYKCGIVVAMH